MTETEPRPPLAWEPPQPREIPALRERMVDQMRNPFEHFNLSRMLSMGLGTVNPDVDNPDRSATLLLEDERQRLTAAQLYSVSGDMTALAVHAGEKLPDWKVERNHVPCAAGFMVFGVPIGAYANAGIGGQRSITVSIVAASWGPTKFAHYDQDNVWVTFWSLTDYEGHIAALREHMGLPHAKARFMAYEHRADLNWDNESILRIGAETATIHGGWPGTVDVDIAQTNMASATTVPWLNTVRAAWLLMRQPKVAEVTEEPLRRTQKRRADRLSLDSSPVRVVHLHSSRQPRAGDAVTGEGTKHTVQYPVSGHWRKQPYRSTGTVEEIWIDDHVRGPDGAPFRAGKAYTVRVLDRPPGR